MVARERLPPWHEHHRLPNGREVLIRPIRPADAGPLHEGFELLQPVAARVRFAGQSDLQPADSERLCRPNPRTDFTLIVTDPVPPGEAVIAALGQVRADTAAHQGEFTLAASAFIEGMGMRRYLLTRLTKWARSRGVGLLRGDLPADNLALLALSESLGFRRLETSVDPSLVQVELATARA